MGQNSNLIGIQDLASRIGEPGMRIVDCRFDLAEPSAGRHSYRKGHIPGAVFADLDEDLAAPISADSGRHPLPDADMLAKTFGRLGIDNSTNVVVYDANSGALAARAWWLLRWVGHDQVQLLDGGYDAWVASRHAVVGGDEQVAATVFLASPRNDMVLTTSELASSLETIGSVRLIDARAVARFRGDIEPIDAVAGHIPGATNVPFQSSLNEDGSWKTKADLAGLWQQALGDDKERAWAVMCGSGVTACHLAISALEAGFREPRLYVGSWSEWIRDPKRPVRVGPGANSHPGPADMT